MAKREGSGKTGDPLSGLCYPFCIHAEYFPHSRLWTMPECLHALCLQSLLQSLRRGMLRCHFLLRLQVSLCSANKWADFSRKQQYRMGGSPQWVAPCFSTFTSEVLILLIFLWCLPGFPGFCYVLIFYSYFVVVFWWEAEFDTSKQLHFTEKITEAQIE